MILYELLSGRLPWDNDTSYNKILLIKEKNELIPFSELKMYHRML